MVFCPDNDEYPKVHPTTGWMIERVVGQQPAGWKFPGWTTDPNQGARFVDQRSAEMVMNSHGLNDPNCWKATEHRWMN